LPNVCFELANPGHVGGIIPVDEDVVRETKIGFTRMVSQFGPGTMAIGHNDVDIGGVEWEFVVAAVPDDDLGVGLGAVQNRLVVDTRIHDVATFDVTLVLLSLLDGHVTLVEVVHRLEPLDPLSDEVTFDKSTLSLEGSEMLDGEGLPLGIADPRCWSQLF